MIINVYARQDTLAHVSAPKIMGKGLRRPQKYALRRWHGWINNYFLHFT